MEIYLVLSGLRLSNGICFMNYYVGVLQFAELQRPEIDQLSAILEMR